MVSDAVVSLVASLAPLAPRTRDEGRGGVGHSKHVVVTKYLLNCTYLHKLNYKDDGAATRGAGCRGAPAARRRRRRRPPRPRRPTRPPPPPPARALQRTAATLRRPATASPAAGRREPLTGHGQRAGGLRQARQLVVQLQPQLVEDLRHHRVAATCVQL